MMKAAVIRKFGAPDNISLEEVEIPEAGADEVRIKVAATSFNPVDASIRQGFMNNVFPVKFPFIPGIDAAGVVDEVGSSVTGFEIGDKVFGFLDMTSNGAAAEYVTTKASNVTPAPTSISLQDSGSVPAVALTAWQGLFDLGKLEAGQRVFINGASGGVGSFAVQLAKWKGAYVIATGSERNHSLLSELGADEIIDYRKDSVQEKLNEKADVVLNLAPVHPEIVNKLLYALKDGGIFVSSTAPADPALAEQLGVQALRIYARQDAVQLKHIAELIDEGIVKPFISGRVPLDQLAAVHQLQDAGQLHGKQLIVVNESL
jgi:NADPH:quinone reductase-like Zn-dependent oxidoreductase